MLNKPLIPAAYFCHVIFCNHVTCQSSISRDRFRMLWSFTIVQNCSKKFSNFKIQFDWIAKPREFRNLIIIGIKMEKKYLTTATDHQWLDWKMHWTFKEVYYCKKLHGKTGIVSKQNLNSMSEKLYRIEIWAYHAHCKIWHTESCSHRKTCIFIEYMNWNMLLYLHWT